MQDHDGYLWVGTFGGLARFDGERFRVLDAAATPGFDNNNILSLYESRPGVLWIGTVAGGVFRLENGVATKYTDRNGLPSRLINFDPWRCRRGHLGQHFAGSSSL